MKKKLVYIVVAACALVAVAFFVFSNKKMFINKKIKSAVRINSDSLYRITYDSSAVDEIAGDAIFYNVQLVVDSGVLKNKINKGDSLPGVLINAKITNIYIKGLRTINLLSGNSVEADSIFLNKPVVTLTILQNKNKKNENIVDTLEIYEQLLGKFNSIKANEIIVKNGEFTYNNPFENQDVKVFGVSVNIQHFLIDSLHNYTNIAAFFIKNAGVKVDSGFVSTNGKKNNIVLNKILYNSDEKTLSCDYLFAEGQRIDSIKFENLSISDFIYRQTFNGQKLTISNVKLSLLKKLNQKAESVYLNLGNVFNEVTVDTLRILNGQLKFADKQGNQHSLTNISGDIYKITIDSNGLSLTTYLQQSSFRIDKLKYAGGKSQAFYSWEVNHLYYNAANKNVSINSLQLIPVAANVFYSRTKFQKDILSATFSNVVAYNCNLFERTESQPLTADKIDLSLDLHVYKDKTLPFDSASKTGKYPHQLIKKMKTKMNVPLLAISNSKVTYTEKSATTLQTASLVFSNIEGKLLRLNNESANDKPMELSVSCRFMNRGNFSTKWELPVSSANGTFLVTGSLSNFDLTAINPVSTKLARLQIKSGAVNKLDFNIHGNDKGGTGKVLFLYKDLGVTLLKSEGDSIVSRKLPSFLLNAGIKNKNEKEEWVPFSVERESYRAFFYVLWKSVFEGVRATVK